MHYYEVAPTKIVRSNAQIFTYHSEDTLPIGAIVTIPIGKTSCLGVVMRKTHTPAFTTRAIAARVIETPLPSPLLATAEWMSNYYTTHLAIVLSSILPRGINKKRRIRSQAVPQPPIRTPLQHTVTPDQSVAIQAISTNTGTTSLLFGVTGSGKTLVYKELAKRALASGKSTILLVPEIALTSQLVDEFLQDFPQQVLLTHSRQTEAERHLVWQQALEADKPLIVIGPRSALFLPLRQVGLIVIDEMHEPSYKQEQAPRYSALRTATILAGHHVAKTVLGSATPPVAEYYTAEHVGALIATLPKRAHAAATTPDIQLVDMAKRAHFSQHRFLSDILLTSIHQTLEQKRQVLIFHNRRGSAAVTLCEHCGWTASDPETGVPLTLHADQHRLMSHLTGFTSPVPTVCPVCHHPDIIHKGIGTKLIETELAKLFPNKKIVRFDGDSGQEHSVETRYKELYDGAIDIIIGTQVIAKGIDLPHLETVGIVQADAGLALPDFTASERVFQLISQAVGRVGRSDRKATIVVQSYQPAHPAVRYGISQQYEAFYSEEITNRQRYHFPPFNYLLKCICIYKTESAALRQAKAVAMDIKKSLGPEEAVLGPTPAFYEKQAGSYRWQIVVRSPSRSRLIELARHIPPGSHWQYELDPTTLL